MYFLILILLLLLLFVLMIFYENAQIVMSFNSNDNEMRMLIYWAYPFLKAKANVKVINNTSSLSIYLFNAKIYSKNLEKPKKSSKFVSKYFPTLALDNAHANVYYGFNNPFYTGITSGMFEPFKHFFKDVLISQYPDFLAEKEYICIKAETEINFGKTLVAMIRLKQADRIFKRRNQYGTI
jgi:hypothetical protein